MKLVQNETESRRRVAKLVDEVEEGQYEVDILKNASYEMVGERQVEYFSHLRENMFTDIAFSIMTNYQQLNDVKFSRMSEKYE